MSIGTTEISATGTTAAEGSTGLGGDGRIGHPFRKTISLVDTTNESAETIEGEYMSAATTTASRTVVHPGQH